MKAIVQDRYGSPDALEIREVDKPVATDNEMLVRCTRPPSTRATGMSCGATRTLRANANRRAHEDGTGLTTGPRPK
jgi:hypothetical protein